jgi:hypothetical protein
LYQENVITLNSHRVYDVNDSLNEKKSIEKYIDKSFKFKNILLVDDDDFNLMSVELNINRKYENIKCYKARNGIEAIE